MISRFFGRPLVGAVLLSLPFVALVPGCGGGGSGSGSGSRQVYFLTGVNFYDGQEGVSQGNLSVTFDPSVSKQQNVIGYLQVVGGVPTATGTPTATSTSPIKTRATNSLRPIVALAATYQLRGTAVFTSPNGPFNVNLRGALSPQRDLKITGNFIPDDTLLLASTFTAPDKTTSNSSLTLLVLRAPVAAQTTPAPIGTALATPLTTGTPSATTSATPNATTRATPLATTTATPFGSTATPVPTATTFPTTSPF